VQTGLYTATMKAMLTSHYNYYLPQDRIALRPPDTRGASRLLLLDRHSGQTQDSHYTQLDQQLRPGDVLVLNDTRVLPARLLTHNVAGQTRELLVLERHSSTDGHHARVMYRGRLHLGETLQIGGVSIRVETLEGDGLAVVGSETDIYLAAEQLGLVPLPPYMHRDADASDTARYQTTFARESGSVAAPTASLNMTPELLSRLVSHGVEIHYLTLHVGLGTFMPIRTDSLEGHKMHQEYFQIPSRTVEAIARAKSTGRRVVALGTTVARTLEYAAKDILAASNPPATAPDATLSTSGPAQSTVTLSGEADIFIYPGYQFQIIDGLLTNFHAPRSSVLMLTASFAGWKQLKHAYEHAIAEKYALLSYGDSMLIV
jgi:S-adenosylmethionine:tRNA ribosyltransferase-isomerase